jgi:CTP synthase (UTP-ammonia lyase)
VDTVTIGIIGDRDPTFEPHRATDEGLRHSADALGRGLRVEWLPTDALAADPQQASRFDGLVCAPGSPYRSLDGALAAVRLARTTGVPLLGTCGGFQHVVLEYARNVLGIANAAHAEYDPYASNLFVDVLACSLAGRTMEVRLTAGSRVAEAYGGLTGDERYYCNFGLTRAAADRLEAGGLRVTGVDQDGEPRVVELPDHPFFVATLFVPQASSTADRPHPLVTRLVEAAG